MTRMIKAVNDGRLALCGWPGSRFVWSLTASLGDLYCNPRLRRVKEKNLPPAEEEEVRPAWSPQVAPLMLLPSSHAVPLMELSARKGQTGCIIITLRWQFLVGNLGLGVTYQVHPVANKLHTQKSAVSNGLSSTRQLYSSKQFGVVFGVGTRKRACGPESSSVNCIFAHRQWASTTWLRSRHLVHMIFNHAQLRRSVLSIGSHSTRMDICDDLFAFRSCS